MKTGSGFIHDVQDVVCRPVLQLSRDLQTLRLPAGERGGRLSEPQIAKPDGRQQIQVRTEFRRAGEEGLGLINGHVQHIVDRLTAESDAQDFRPKASSSARFTPCVHIFKEIHLQFLVPVPLTPIAPPTRRVEREMCGREASAARLECRGEEPADLVESLQVGDGI